MIILETTRLILKTIEKEDSQTLHDLIFSNEDTMKYTFGNKAFTLEETKKFIYKNFCKNNAIVGLAPLFEKKSGLLIGMAGVLKNETLGKEHYEFGFIIAEEYRKNGYAMEIAQSEITFIKKRLKQQYAYALINPQNEVSKHLIEKLGLTHEKDIELKDRGQRAVYKKRV